MGHETVLTTLTLFGRQKSVDENNKKEESNEIETLRFDQEYLFVDNIDEKNANEEGDEKTDLVKDLVIYALLEFERPVLIAPKSKGKCNNLAINSSNHL